MKEKERRITKKKDGDGLALDTDRHFPTDDSKSEPPLGRAFIRPAERPDVGDPGRS